MVDSGERIIIIIIIEYTEYAVYFVGGLVGNYKTHIMVNIVPKKFMN